MKKLYRSNQKSIAGICSGIGNYLQIDETIIRVLFVLLFFTPFPIFITYLLLWLIVPSES
jgi:phage shock protein C